MARMGRPPRSEVSERVRVSVVLTPQERKMFLELAKGIPLSQFLRETILKLGSKNAA
jgi:hypothetical protein